MLLYIKNEYIITQHIVLLYIKNEYDRYIMSDAVGWIDLDGILKLFNEKNELEWLTMAIINNLLADRGNRMTFWNRPKECQKLLQMLQEREYDKKLKYLSIV